MLAYVFWHRPSPHADRTDYELQLTAFHSALAEHSPPGFQSSAAYAIEGEAPWMPGEETYEDWYLVSDYTALGTLNDAAVTGELKNPHDTIAEPSADGAGALYALRRGDADQAATRNAAWLWKPRGMPYEDFEANLPAGTLWQRQLVLGPSPEYCLRSGSPIEVPGGLALDLRRVT